MTSCSGCCNFADEKTSAKIWGHDFGVPSCRKLGHLLGMPNEPDADRETTLTAFAAGCPSVDLKGDDKSNPMFRVFKGADNVAASMMGHLTPERPRITKCSECANYISGRTIRETHGWSAGGCAVYGVVLSGNQAMTMPKTCPAYAQKEWVRAEGVPIKIRTSIGSITNEEALDGLSLLDNYSGQGRATIVRTSSTMSAPTRKRAVKVSLDPRGGPFHRESSADEKAFGILGWNQLTMEGARKELEYPVFAQWLFDDDPAEVAKIPTATDGSGIHLYRDYDDAVFQLYGNMRKGITPIFVGPAGTGKTEAYRFMAYLMGLPFDRISISKSTEADDLLGSWLLKDGNMEWIYGRLALRMVRPGVLLIDEPNMGINEVWEVLRPLTDNAKQIVLDKKDGEVLNKHARCYFGMAMNPAWDPLYVGAQDISVADQSRTISIAAGLPPVDVEKKILKDRCKLGDPRNGVDPFTLDKDDLTSIMKISTLIRKATDRNNGGELEFSWGVRSNLAVAMLTDTFDLKHCYRLVATNALDPEQASIIHALVEGVIA